MSRNELNRAVIFVANGGGSIICENHDGSRVAWERGFAPGRYQAKDLIQDIPEGYSLRAGMGASIMVPPLKHQRGNYGARALESGANPDFTPSRLTDAELQLRNLVAAVSADSKAIKRRMAALEAQERRALPFPVPEKDTGAELEVPSEPVSPPADQENPA